MNSEVAIGWLFIVGVTSLIALALVVLFKENDDDCNPFDLDEGDYVSGDHCMRCFGRGVVFRLDGRFLPCGDCEHRRHDLGGES